MAFRLERPLHVVVHGPRTPSNGEWTSFTRAVHELGPTVSNCRVVVYSHGGGPEGTQRRALTDAIVGEPAPTALLTDSTLVRGIGIALKWLNHRLRVFALADEQEAFEYLGLSAAQREQVKSLRGLLERELGLR